MFISLWYATGGLSLPYHDTLAVWARYLARRFPAKTNRVTVWLSPEIWPRVLKWTKHQLSLYHNLPMLNRLLLPVLHLVRIMPFYSRKTIDAYQNKHPIRLWRKHKGAISGCEASRMKFTDQRKDDFLKLIMQPSSSFVRDARLHCSWIMIYSQGGVKKGQIFEHSSKSF
jgi:hypothetical protein